MKNIILIVAILSSIFITNSSAKITQENRDKQIVAEYGNNHITVLDIRNYLNRDTLSLKEIAKMHSNGNYDKAIKGVIQKRFATDTAYNSDIVKTTEYRQKIEEHRNTIALNIYKIKNNISDTTFEIKKEQDKNYEKKILKEALKDPIFKTKSSKKIVENSYKNIALKLILKQIKISNKDIEQEFQNIKKEKAKFETYMIVLKTKDKALQLIKELDKCEKDRHCLKFKKFKKFIDKYSIDENKKILKGHFGYVKCNKETYSPKEFCNILPYLGEEDFTKTPILYYDNYHILYVKNIQDFYLDKTIKKEVIYKLQKQKYYEQLKPDFEKYYKNLKIDNLF